MILEINQLCEIPMPANEAERQHELDELGILNTLSEKEYDTLVKLVADICQAPVSAVSLVDRNRVWAKANKGLGGQEMPRQLSFCAHAIANPTEVLIVPDAREDIRFCNNPLVTTWPKVNFYAGVPLVTKSGNALGTLCIIDTKPRNLHPWQIAALQSIAAQVVSLFELRKANADLIASKEELAAKNIELKKFAYTITHDIKSPAGNLIMASSILKADFESALGENGNTLLDYLVNSSTKIKELVDGVLAYYTSDELLKKARTAIDLQTFLHQMADFITINDNVEFIYPEAAATINTNKVVLEQLYINLTNNAIKYNDKDKVVIVYGYSENDTHYCFNVKDNGKGMPADKLDTIFDLFSTLDNRDRYGNQGTGIGLSTVKKLVERMGGEITVQSEEGVGTEFIFSIRK